MNKQQKEVQQQFLDNEKAILKSLKETYQDAIDEINSKIEILMARQDADMQHVIYQVEYQKALKSQIQGILDNMQANEFESISEYLTSSYEDGFIGAMYDMQKQGVPLVMPIDQEQVVAAIQHETKLSENLYTALGKDVKDLQKKIAGEISRGIAGGQMFSEIARNISGYAGISRNNAVRIARTEGHRIQCKAASDAQWKAKSKGADVVKQWDSALDGKTRPTHRKLDGQIRELDESFEIDGMKAMFPADFGRAAEDINCRCALLQRARWALEEDIPVTKWSEDAPVLIDDDGTTQFVDLSDAKNYKQFKERYNKTVQDVAKDRFNMFSNNNKSNPKYYDYKGKDISTVEKELCNLDYEVGVIFDKNGKAISCQLGNEDTVSFTPYQARLMKGKDVTHNHPTNTHPSPEDLYIMVNRKAKSFRTCGKYGTYVLKYSQKVENLPEFAVFSDKFDEFVEKYQPKYQEAVRKGMSEQEALIGLGDEVWEELYKLYGIKPTFESR